MGEQRPQTLSLEELGRITGAQPDELRHWRSLDLIGSQDSEAFAAADVERVRLIELCLEHGFDAPSIALAEKQERGFLSRYVDQLFPQGVGAAYSLAEAAAAVQLDETLVRRLWETIASGESRERLDAQDVEVLRGWNVALENGLPEEALLELVRVYADALGRVAEAEARLFHFYVHERLRTAGLSGAALTEATEAAAQPMRELIEPAVLYFHRKGMARALREDMLMHLAAHITPAETADAPGELRRAIAFVDLASFTPLTESMGDAAAAEVVARFSELVREVVNTTHGRVVERIGDAFLIVFPEARSAIRCALEIDRRARAESHFPAVRGGIHVGRVLYREGGYVGAAMNLAARVAAQAGRHQTLVTPDARAEAGTLEGVEFVPLGKRRLKGLVEEVELFEARPIEAPTEERVVDPVCGMEMTSGAVAATITLGGRQRSFCSEKCLRDFVAAPERYAG